MKPETKALLKAARAERGGPTAEARSRMRGKVLAAVGATAVASSTAAAGSAVAGTASAARVGGAGVATAGAASGVSWAIGTGVVVVALGGGYVLREASREAPSLDDAARTEATAVTSTSENAASVRNAVAASPQTASPQTASQEAAGSAGHGSEPPAAAAVPAAPRNSSARPAASASESTPPSHAIDAATVSADALAEESALLATARSALASGDPKAALRALGDHATRFPRGVLSSERRALTAMALCADGRAAEGLATFPLPDEASDTPLSRRVRSACAR